MKKFNTGHALIFDSGVGGLSVVTEIAKLNTNLKLTYIADDNFRPYGEKTELQLKSRLPRLLWELTETFKPDLVVIACNTASTTTLDEIRSELSVPVIGVVPAIKPAANLSRTKTIAVIGTPGTVKRRYVDKLINEHASDCRVILQGSVNLVDIAEKKMMGEKINEDWVKTEITPMFGGQYGADIDAVVLACTHFPLLLEELKSSVSQSVNWVDSGDAVARRVNSVIKTLHLESRKFETNKAFLIGPNTCINRYKTFNSYGFEKVTGLLLD